MAHNAATLRPSYDQHLRHASAPGWALYLKRALADHDTLTHLDLTDTGLGEKGAEYLVNGVYRNVRTVPRP